MQSRRCAHFAASLSEKVAFASPVRLQARSRRLWLTTNLLRVRGRRAAASFRRSNVGAKVRFCSGLFFATKNKPAARSLAPPFRKKSGSVRLFACKRPLHGLAVATNFLRAAWSFFTPSAETVKISLPRRSKLHIACSDFFKSQSVLIPLLLLFRKRSRSHRLFACRRAHDGFGSLPTFCGDAGQLRLFRSTTSEQSPLCSGLFFCKNSHPPASLLLLFRKKSRSAHLFGCRRPQRLAVATNFLRAAWAYPPPAKTVKTSSEQAAYRLLRLFQKSERAHSAAPPFPQRSRSRRLFACRRAHDGFGSLPTFLRVRGADGRIFFHGPLPAHAIYSGEKSKEKRKYM